MLAQKIKYTILISFILLFLVEQIQAEEIKNVSLFMENIDQNSFNEDSQQIQEQKRYQSQRNLYFPEQFRQFQSVGKIGTNFIALSNLPTPDSKIANVKFQVFTQSQCPETFVLNQDSICVCRKYSTLSNQKCQCNYNFQDSADGSCQCQEPFEIQNETCGCRKYQTQVGLFCRCQQNFIKNDLQCLCDSPFVLDNDECMCPVNSTQRLNECLCDENFINQDGLCICPSTFMYSDGKCSCLDQKFIHEGECVECGVWCSECDGPGFSCVSFSVEFYLIVIGGSLVVLGVIIGVVMVIKMRRSQKDNSLLEQQNNNQTNEKMNQQGLLGNKN